MSAKKVYFDTLRSLAFGSISGTYAAVGTALTVNPRTMRIVNETNAGMIFSDDNTVAAGKIYLPANSFLLLDLTANMNPEKDDAYVMSIGTIIYVKQSTAPSSGSVYLEYTYAGHI